MLLLHIESVPEIQNQILLAMDSVHKNNITNLDEHRPEMLSFPSFRIFVLKKEIYIFLCYLWKCMTHRFQMQYIFFNDIL